MKGSSLSKSEFHSNIFSTLKKSGVADKLKSQLRAKLVAELVLKSKTIQPALIEQETIYIKVIDSLIVDYLKSKNYDFTVSVFMPESGQTKQLLNLSDLHALLHLSTPCSLTTIVASFSEHPIPLLEKIIKALALCTSIPLLNKDSQTETDQQDVLEWSIRQCDKDASLKSIQSHKMNVIAMEERMLRYQADVDSRMKMEMEDQLSKFKELELAHVRIEERHRYASELQRMKLEFDKKTVEIAARSNDTQESDRKRLDARELEMEKQNSELRSKLLEESRRTLVAEMTAKTDAELMAKELKMDRDALQKKHEEAMAQIAELSTMKDRYAEKLHENTTRYKIDLNREHAAMISSVEIEKTRLESERSILSERQKIAEQLFAQSRAMNDETESLRNQVKNLKSTLANCESDRDSAREKIRDLELQVNIQHNSTALEFELSSLKRQLFEAEKTAQARQEEYQAKMLKYINPEEKQQVQRLNEELENLRKSESKWQRECQTLVYKLDIEINRNEDLQKKYGASVMMCKELRRDMSQLRLLLHQRNCK